jgi:hypothetical protein
MRSLERIRELLVDGADIVFTAHSTIHRNLGHSKLLDVIDDVIDVFEEALGLVVTNKPSPRPGILRKLKEDGIKCLEDFERQMEKMNDPTGGPEENITEQIKELHKVIDSLKGNFPGFTLVRSPPGLSPGGGSSSSGGKRTRKQKRKTKNTKKHRRR